MTRLQDLIEDEFQTPQAQLALELSREDQHMLAELVAIRNKRGLSQEDVADLLGLSQATISAFERVGNDPHLSTVRRYARAINVMIRHHLDDDPSHEIDSHFLSHVDNDGVHSRQTASAVARALRNGGGVEWPEIAREAGKSAVEATARQAEKVAQ